MKPLAGSLGGLFGQVATSLKNALGGGALGAILGNVTTMFNNIRAAVDPFIQGFITLSNVGSSFLPQFGTWVTQIANGFNGWVQGAAASGDLQKMIAGALEQVKLLGSALSSAWDIIKGLIGAAQAAGSGGLSTMASVLKTASIVRRRWSATSSAVDGCDPGLSVQ